MGCGGRGVGSGPGEVSTGVCWGRLHICSYQWCNVIVLLGFGLVLMVFDAIGSAGVWVGSFPNCANFPIELVGRFWMPSGIVEIIRRLDGGQMYTSGWGDFSVVLERTKS